MIRTQWHEKANKQQKSGTGQKNKEIEGYLLLLERIKIGLNQFTVCFQLSCWPFLTEQTLESSLELWFYSREGKYIQSVSEGCACITYTSRAHIYIESFSEQIKLCLCVGNFYPVMLTDPFYSWVPQKNINNLTILLGFDQLYLILIYFLPFSITALILFLHHFHCVLRNCPGGLSDIKDVIIKNGTSIIRFQGNSLT